MVRLVGISDSISLSYRALCKSRYDKSKWKIAGHLRGAVNADDFRDDMLFFLFLRSVSDNDEIEAARKPRKDYPTLAGDAG